MEKAQKADLVALIDAVTAATKEHSDAMVEAERASAHEVRALNALSKAQHALDAALAEMGKAAPRGTPWHDKRTATAGGPYPVGQ